MGTYMTSPIGIWEPVLGGALARESCTSRIDSMRPQSAQRIMMLSVGAGGVDWLSARGMAIKRSATMPVNVRRTSLFRNCLQHVQRGEQETRLSQFIEPPCVDVLDIAGSEDLRESAVHRQAEVRVVAPQGKRIRLD